MNFQKILNYILIALIAVLVVQFFQPKATTTDEVKPSEDVVIAMLTTIGLGEPVTLTLTNTTKAAVMFALACPDEPFDIARYDDGSWAKQSATAVTSRCAAREVSLPAGESLAVNYEPWQKSLFTMAGKYRVSVPVTIAGATKSFEHTFEITPPSFFGRVWEGGFIQPMYNALILGIDLAPAHSLAVGIILLTLAIRLVLVWPFQISMVAQRKMQRIQPEINALKEKYKENQAMLATETMALYKKHGVNPFGSCLPIIIQMPFLIAIFQIVSHGTTESNLRLLYAPLSAFDLSAVNPHFLGLNLLEPNVYVLPVVIGLLQFAQMHLAMSHAQKQKAVAAPSSSDDPMAAAMADMTKYMKYIMPAMIAVFTASVPAAVGIYWGVSTLFGIGQQLVVNRLVK